MKNKDGGIETTSRGKAQTLNAQYSSVFSEENVYDIPDLGESPYPEMPRIKVSVNGVSCLLKKLNPSKAIGPDMVPTRILRDYADDVSVMLQVIFQQSLDTGDVPADWRTANVVAIFKKGDRHMPSNYRPVSYMC